jgi:acetoin utilization deacetylase AcuC-like enzyme
MELAAVSEALGRAAGRTRRLLVANLARPAGHLIYHPGYRGPSSDIADPRRAQKVLGYLVREGCASLRHLRLPSHATLHQLGRVHPCGYLESLDDVATVRRIFGADLSDAAAAGLVAQQRLMVGGTIRAATMAVYRTNGGRPVINLGGGFHHARSDSGAGFCLLNDIAVAVAQLRREGYAGRILVVDLDLHQGDGTRRIFAEDETVFTYSVHANDWDVEPAVADLNVPLGAGIGDRAYLDAVGRTLPEAFRGGRPDLVFYVAGVDVAADDHLGSWRVSADAILERDRMVLEQTAGRPLVWVLAGGYGPDAWRHTARSLGWLLAGLAAPIASRGEADLRHFRQVARTLERWELSGQAPEEEIELTTADVLGDLWERPSHAKFLGLYSAYGLECVLERYGVLPHLRELGFRRFRVELELEHSTGQRARLYSDEGRPELLIELVLREDGSHPPHRLLLVEWLLLQNPRAQPTPERPLLPGQEHPGLGCVWEIGLLLLMACERLGFDGLAFNPAHYHLAVQGKGRLFFLDPALQARFSAMQAALERLGLGEASRVVESGGLVDARTGEPFRWQPGLMVVPVSEALQGYFGGAEYEQAVGVAAGELRVERGEGEKGGEGGEG